MKNYFVVESQQDRFRDDAVVAILIHNTLPAYSVIARPPLTEEFFNGLSEKRTFPSVAPNVRYAAQYFRNRQ